MKANIFRSKTWQWVGGGGLLVLAIAAMVYVMSGTQEKNEDFVVISPSSNIVNVEASMAYLEEKVRKHPSEERYRLALTQVYLQHAAASREEELYLPKAERLLSDLLKKHPEHYEARALQARLLNTFHRFEEARDISEALLAENSHKAYVYGILVDALVELGAYEQAVEACDQMIALRPGLTSYARASYLRELHGDTEGAIQAMEMAVQAGVAGSSERSWALYQLGQLYLGENDVQRAAKVFEGTLEEDPGNAFAKGGLGHAHLIWGDLEEAVALFEEAYAMVPADEFLEGLVEAYAELGEEGKVAEMLEALETNLISADRMGENVRMEYADFLIDLDRDLTQALEWAELEYQRRPGHLHALETYAWALHKMGRSQEATSYIDEAMRLGTGDAMVHYRAGTIYEGAQQPELARHHFEAAIEANLHIESPTAAREVTATLGGWYADATL